MTDNLAKFVTMDQNYQNMQPEAPKVEQKRFNEKDIEENKVMAAISYLFILFLIPLLGAKESEFAQAHARQGMALAVFGVAVMFINTLIGWIPLIGWLIAIVLSISWIVFSITGMVKALSGEAWEMPILGSHFRNVKF